MAAIALEAMGDPLSQAEIDPLLVAHERYAACQGGKRIQLTRRRLDGLNLANRKLCRGRFHRLFTCWRDALRFEFGARERYFIARTRAAICRRLNCFVQIFAALASRAPICLTRFSMAPTYAPHASMVYEDGAAKMVDRAVDPDTGTARLQDSVDFSNCSMKNVSMGNAKLDNADFSGAVLEGVKFKGAQLNNVNFKGAVLTGINLGDLAVAADALADCILDISPAAQARAVALKEIVLGHESWLKQEEGAPGVLDGEDLRPLKDLPPGRKLAGLSANRVVAIEVNFTFCHLQAARFTDADLRKADFTDSDLRGVSFKGAKLSHARFANAKIGSLKLPNGAEVVTDFSELTVSMDQFLDASLDRPLSSMGLGRPGSSPAG